MRHVSSHAALTVYISPGGALLSPTLQQRCFTLMHYTTFLPFPALVHFPPLFSPFRRFPKQQTVHFSPVAE